MTKGEPRWTTARSGLGGEQPKVGGSSPRPGGAAPSRAPCSRGGLQLHSNSHQLLLFGGEAKAAQALPRDLMLVGLGTRRGEALQCCLQKEVDTSWDMELLLWRKSKKQSLRGPSRRALLCLAPPQASWLCAELRWDGCVSDRAGRFRLLLTRPAQAPRNELLPHTSQQT